MKPRSALAIFCLAGALALVPAAAASQPGPVPPEQRNAAIPYAVAFSQIGPELAQTIGDLDYEALPTDPGEPAPQSFAKAVEQLQQAEQTIAMLVDASRLGKCDWELDYQQGPSLLLPQYGKLRQAERLLRADARRLLLEGKPEEAAERIAAMLRMAYHTDNDQIMLGSLVAVAMIMQAAGEIDALDESGTLTPDARRILLDALGGFDAADPAGIKAAVRGEQRWLGGWIRSFEGPDAGRHVTAVFGEQLTGGALAPSPKPGPAPAPAPAQAPPPVVPKPSKPEISHEQAAAQVKAMDARTLRAATDQMDRFYDQALRIWEEPDATAKLRELYARVHQGEFGPLTVIVGPAIHRAKDAADRAAARVEQTVQRLSAAN